ncbi:MAG: hypothetical protein RR182_00050 [Alistipes sp.]
MRDWLTDEELDILCRSCNQLYHESVPAVTPRVRVLLKRLRSRGLIYGSCTDVRYSDPGHKGTNYKRPRVRHEHTDRRTLEVQRHKHK